MRRWDALESSHPIVGGPRPRAFPIGPIDAVPAHIIEAAKRLFLDYWAFRARPHPLPDPAPGQSY